MRSLLRHINIIARCAGMYRADKLGSSDLGAVYHSYILTIFNNPGISQDELAQNIYINKSNVTRKVNFLEENGYVTRRQSKTDRRVIHVYPTDKMAQLYPKVRAITDECNEYLTDGLSEQQIEQLRMLLEYVSGRAKKYVNSRGTDA